MADDLSDDRKRLGARGENVARLHLERIGWRILAANFRCKHGEMDLIAEDASTGDPVLVFVEVKTRRGAQHGSPVEAVDARKQRKLIAIAHDYLAQRDAGGQEPSCRFDVAEVHIGTDGLISIRLLNALFGANF